MSQTRIIAEAKIKNDRMDARVLADLVRADLVAESYVPTNEIRELPIHALDRRRSAHTGVYQPERVDTDPFCEGFQRHRKPNG